MTPELTAALRQLALWATAEVVHHPEYSAGKWRVEDIAGQTMLGAYQPHPSGDPQVPGARELLCYDRKAEAVERLQGGRRAAAFRALLLDPDLPHVTLAVFELAAAEAIANEY
ncbi:MAG TPA: hypothetical protein VK507_19160 [Iamia sp.]|nr:hypothetical protein [Iamia sp.]